MAKIVLSSISSGYQSTAQVNSNSDAVEDNLNNKVLYRDNPEGEINHMLNLLDMNAQNIINLPDATTPTQPVTLGQLTTLLGISFPDNFISVCVEEQLAIAGQTNFILVVCNATPGEDNLSAYINGVYQAPSQYTQPANNQVVFNEGLSEGDIVAFTINQRAASSDAGIFSATTTELENSSSNINAANKVIGKSVFNTTTSTPVWASGVLSTSIWVDATGSTTHTPV